MGDRIAEINSVKNRLLQALKDSGARGVTEAYNWVESHRSEFCGEVHGPVLLEVGHFRNIRLFLLERCCVVQFCMPEYCRT